jgi:glycosyltransferase involved in cell wall biosynthesis
MGMNPIKVLHLIASNGIGGAENVLLDICRSLESDKFQFEVALFVNAGREKENALGQILKLNHIPVHFIKMRFPLSTHLGEIYNVTGLFRKTNISVVHCHGFRADVLGGLAARLCGVSAISTVHGWIAYSRKMRFYKWLDLKALHLFKTILPVSIKLRQELLQNKIPAEKIQLLRNVPRLKQFSLPRVRNSSREDGLVQVGFVGRLSPEKGITFLIEALNRVKEAPPVYLHIVGDGPEKTEIINKIKILGLEDRVRVHGHIIYPEDIYAVLDILVLPSLTEGIPLTLLEGMSFGNPIIASNVGGIPEIVQNNENGLLVEPGSVTELAEKISLLIKNPGLRNRLGKKGKETISVLCDRNQWTHTLMKVYQQYGGEGHD